MNSEEGLFQFSGIPMSKGIVYVRFMSFRCRIFKVGDLLFIKKKFLLCFGKSKSESFVFSGACVMLTTSTLLNVLQCFLKMLNRFP